MTELITKEYYEVQFEHTLIPGEWRRQCGARRGKDAKAWVDYYRHHQPELKWRVVQIANVITTRVVEY